MRLFLEYVCLSTNMDLRLRKKNKKLWNGFNIIFSKFLLPPAKNASHTIFISGNGIITVFSQKKET